MFAIRTLRNASNQIISHPDTLTANVSHSCQRVYCTETGSVMRHAASRPPLNKDCSIKDKQLYNVLLDMEGCPSFVNMQCLRVCAIILQFETLLSDSANYTPLSAAVAQASTVHCYRHGEYSVPHIHTMGCAFAPAHQSLNQLLWNYFT